MSKAQRKGDFSFPTRTLKCEERVLFMSTAISHTRVFFVFATTKERFSFLLVLPDFTCVVPINFVL